MNRLDLDGISVEPERYELAEGPRYHFSVDRRKFFKVLGGGVVVLLFAQPALAQESGQAGRRRGGGQRPAELDAWLHIGEDGTVMVFSGKAEVGQNIRTSLTQVVAEELHIPISSVQMVMGDTGRTPYDAGTFGSRTTPDMSVQLRRVGATAREALLDLAAESFQTDRKNLAVADGKISRLDTKESLTFGQLTKGQQLMKSVTEQAPTVPAREWKIAGTSVPKVDGREFVTGRHQYASDVKRPGMLHGKVLRPAAFDATVASIDTKAVEAMPNVTIVREGAFVGVTAPDAQLAARAIEAFRTEWTTKPQSSSAQLFEELKKNASQGGDNRGGRGGGGGGGNKGSMEEGLAQADQKLESTYTVAYIAHVPLEPRAAVAEWQDDKLTVWTGTQRPFGVRGDLAQAFGISQDLVRVIVPDTGSGYGGKHSGEAAIEAARLAKAAGKPVKLVWTREEEFTWAYFRPAGVLDITSGVRNDGTLTAWEFHNYNSGGSAIRTPYEVPNQKVEFHSTRSPLRQGSYRALASTANIFARESHMDELAHAIKMDPLEFRLKNLKDERLRAVLEKAADAFGWKKANSGEGRGFGISCGTEKNSYIATCAEVVADRRTKSVKVLRAVSAFECGAVINPDHLKSQVEGAMVMGLGGALFEAIEFENGRIKNPRLSSYRVPRFSDAPSIEVVLVNRPDLPSAGAGETPIVGIAPAVGNAIFAASGSRLRSMPMRFES
jgi:nicotinate dehydrogenase subunit B